MQEALVWVSNQLIADKDAFIQRMFENNDV